MNNHNLLSDNSLLVVPPDHFLTTACSWKLNTSYTWAQTDNIRVIRVMMYEAPNSFSVRLSQD